MMLSLRSFLSVSLPFFAPFAFFAVQRDAESILPPRAEHGVEVLRKDAINLLAPVVAHRHAVNILMRKRSMDAFTMGEHGRLHKS